MKDEEKNMYTWTLEGLRKEVEDRANDLLEGEFPYNSFIPIELSSDWDEVLIDWLEDFPLCDDKEIDEMIDRLAMEAIEEYYIDKYESEMDYVY